MIWTCGRYHIDAQKPVVMGILNVTPDSFSDGGLHADAQAAIDAGRAMHEAGALIIDVGGESTAPGAVPVSPDEEAARVVGVVRALAVEGICLSIDTRHAQVAQAAVEAGAAIINDVTGFSDPAMVRVAQGCDAGLIVMHGRTPVRTGDGAADALAGLPGFPCPEGAPAALAPAPADAPALMEDLQDPSFDAVAYVRDYLVARAGQLEAAGIARERIAIDPGPGFGKAHRQSLDLMRNLHLFARTGYPVVAAPSRKRYVGWAYNVEGEPAARDDASAQEALLAAELGAAVLRMHNVPLAISKLEDVRPYALVALGCNVPLVANPGEEREGKIAMLNQAISDMCLLPDTQLVDVSALYESEPAYVEDQDAFVNAMALLRTGLAPRDLLRCLHAIEDSLGRVRGEGYVPNGPRTCDLDIVDYQLYVSADEELTLPHPRATERDFVVKPLLELAPRHVLSDGTPVTIETVRVGKAERISR